MMGDVITATFFMLTLVATIIITLIVMTYGMHCLMVVARDTSDGNDEIIWPAEPFQDWVGGALHLVLVVVIVLAPAAILSRSLRKDWLPGEDALRFLLLAVPTLWLLLPVALLSSLSGSSRWFVLRPVVLWNLLRVAPATFVVYVLSALLAAAVAALGYFAIIRGWLVLTPVVAAAAAAAFLIYARLLGRLAWRIGRLSFGKRKTIKPALPKGAKVEVQDPWAVPEATDFEPPLSEEEVTPFGRKQKRTKGYAMAAEAPVKPSEGNSPMTAAAAHRTPRPKRPPAPGRFILAGVFTFPWYTQSRKAWLLLSLGFLGVGALAWELVRLYGILFKDG